MSRFASLLLTASLCIIVFVASTAAFAATYVWDIAPGAVGAGDNTISDGSGTWNTVLGNWTSDSGATNVAWTNNTTDIAAFGGTGNTGGTVTISGLFSAGGILFDGSDSGVYTLQGTGSPTLTLGASGITMNNGAGADVIGSTTAANNFTIQLGGSETWTNNSTTSSLTINSTVNEAATSTLTIGGAGNINFGSSAVISNGTGSLSLYKTGTGTLTLGAVSSFSGGITVSQGTLSTSVINAAGNNAITLGDANTGNNNVVLMTTSTQGGGSGFVGNGTITVSAADSGAGTVTIDIGPQNALWTNNFVINRPTIVQSDATGGGAYFGGGNSNTLTGTGSLTLKSVAGGKLYLQANGSGYAQPVTIFAGSIIAPTSVTLPFGTGPLTMQSNAKIDMTVFNSSFTVTDLSDAGGSGASVVVGGNTLTVNSVAGSTFGGVISGSGGKLTKIGAGVLTLSGANSYTGATNLQNGTIRIGAANSLPIGTALTFGTSSTSATLDLNGFNQQVGALALGSGASALNQTITNNSATADSVLTLNSVGTLSFGGTIRDGGSGHKTGLTLNAGTLTLAGSNNTFSGPTTIGGGKIYVNGIDANSPIGVASGATLGGTGSVGAVTIQSGGILEAGQAGAGSSTLSSLSFVGAATLNIALPSGSLSQYLASSSGPLAIDDTGLLTANGGSSSIVINLPTASVSSGVYRLIGYSGSLGGDFDAFTLGTQPLVGGGQISMLTNNTTTHEIDLVVTGDTPLWTGAFSSQWSTNTIPSPKNWKFSSSGTPIDYADGNTVHFDNTAANQIVDISQANVFPASAVFDSGNYTLESSTGSFGMSSGTLVLNGATLTITNVNTYGGGTALNSGLLSFVNGALGSGAITFAGNATLQWASGNTQDISNQLVMSDGVAATFDTQSNSVTLNSSIGNGSSGSLVKAGSGTLALAAANSYTGGTTLNSGTLAFASGGLGPSGAITFSGNSTLQWLSGNTQDISSRLVINSGVTATLDTQNNNVTFATALPATSIGGLVKTGTGTLTLGTVNTFSGGITVSQGTLSTSVIGAAGNNAITLGDANTGDNNVVLMTTSTQGGGSGFVGNGTITVSATDSGAGTATIDIGPQNALWTNNFVINRPTIVQSDAAGGGAYFGGGNSNTLTGTGSLTLKSVAGGKLYLQANGSGYAQPVTIFAGSIIAPTSVTLPFGTGPLTMQSNAKIDMTVFNSSFTVTDLSDAGGSGASIVVGGNTLTVNSVAGSEFGGVISGSGGKLTKIGAGTLTLSGTDTYTGATTISGGILRIGDGGSAGALATTSAISDNATLAFDRGDNYGGPITNLIGGSGSVALTAGTLGLTAANTYTGSTRISGGAVFNANTLAAVGAASSIGKGSAAGSAADLVIDGGTLQYTGISAATTNRLFTVGASGNATLDASGTGNGSLTLGSAGGAVAFVNSAVPATLTLTGSGAGGAAGTLAASIGDSGTGGNITSVVKSSGGTWILGGTNSYTGSTTIGGGKLYLNGNNATPTIAVAGGATLGGSGSASAATATIADTGAVEAGSAGVGSLSLAGLSFANTGTIRIANVGNYTTSAAVQVTGNNGLTAGGAANSIAIVLTGALPSGSGTAHLIQFAGAIQGAGYPAFNLDTSGLSGLSSRSLFSLTNADPGYIDLNYSVDHPVWSGALDGVWDTAVQAAPKNWVLASNSATTTDFQAGDSPVFDDSATGTTTVSISGSGDVFPNLVTFNNTNKSYVLQGTHGIAGSASLAVSGGGLVTITNVNSYTGGTTLTSGTLSFVNGALGSGAITFAGNATLQWASGNTQDISNQLVINNGAVATLDTQDNSVTLASSFGSGSSGGLVKIGSGTLALATANSYTGGTMLNSGTLAFASGGLGPSGAITFSGNSTLQWIGGNTQDISSRLVINSGVTATLDTQNNNVTFATALPATSIGGLVKTGTGTLTLGTVNTFSGGITVSQGTLSTSVIGAAGNNAITLGDANTGDNNVVIMTTSTQGGGSGFVGNGTITVSAADSGAGTVTIDIGPQNALWTNNFVINRPTIVQSDATGGGAYFGGGNSNTLTGTGSLTLKSVAGGKLYLQANGSGYAQPVTIFAGSIIAPTSVTLPFGTGPLTMQSNAKIDMTVFNPSFTVTDLSDAGASGASVVVGGNTLTVNSVAGSTFGGVISGSGGNLTKQGAGTFDLAGGNSYTGATNVNAGTLTVDGSLNGGSTVTVNDAATLSGVGAVGGPVILAGGATGSTLTSASTLTLNSTLMVNGGNNQIPAGIITVAGVTTINSGASLTVSGTLSGGNNNRVFGTLRGTGTINQPVTINSSGSIAAASGATLRITDGLILSDDSFSTFALTPAGADNPTALVAVTGGFTGPTMIPHTINIAGAAAAGTYDLYSYDTGSPTLAQFTFGALPADTLNYSLAIANNQIDLIVNNPASSAAWNFAGGGNFSDTTKWLPTQVPNGVGLIATFAGGSIAAPINSTTVGGSAISVTIDGADTVGSLVFDNPTVNYTLANDFLFGHGLTLDNAGAVNGSFTGAVVAVNTGSHTIAANLTLADSAGTTFNLAGGTSLAVSGIIGGSGANQSLTLTGGGTLILSNANTYNGGNTIAAGTLRTTVSGALGTGPLAVNSAGTATPLVDVNSNESVGGLTGGVSGSGSATVQVELDKSLTVAPVLGTSTFSGTVNLAAGNMTPGGTLGKSGGGTEVLAGAVQLNNNSVLNVSGGTLRVNASGGTIGTGVTADISGTGTLELAGAYSALGTTTPANRAVITNNSTAIAGVLVSSGNQQVGAIEGTGNVQVTPPTGQSDSLTADHIIAGSLIIGGDATSSALVTIAASDSDGNPTTSTGFALAGSLAPSAPFAGGTQNSSSLIAAGDSSGNSLNVGGSTFGGLDLGSNVAAVPEPSTILLLLLGSLALWLPIAQRRASRSQALPGNALPPRLRLDVTAQGSRL